MSITKLTISRVEAYKNLATSEDRQIFTSITNELKKLSKMNIEDKRSYLTDSSSYIYRYKLIPSALLELATKIVDEASDTVTKEAAQERYDLNQALNRSIGYYEVRRTRLIRKMIDVLMLLPKNLARYNEAVYYRLFGVNSEYDYQNITYVPKSSLVEICGEHSNTDYHVVLDALRISGIIKTPINKWFFTPDDPASNGTSAKKRDGIAKPMWVDLNQITTIQRAMDSRMTYMEADDCYEYKIEKLKDSSDEVLYAIASLLCLIPSDSIYLGAQKRLRLPAKIVRIKEGFDFGPSEVHDEGRLILHEVIDNMRVSIKDRVDTEVWMDFSYGSSLSIKNMAESNIFELLRFTTDDYSGRLHTALTRLKREFKDHLIFITGSRIADIDIRACQPTIFCALLTQKGYPELYNLVKGRDFYSVFHQMMNDEDPTKDVQLSESERERAKQLCMEVLFSNGARFEKFMFKLTSLITTHDTRYLDFQELMRMMSIGSHPYNREDGMYIEDRSEIDYSRRRFSKLAVSTIPKRLQSLEVKMMFGPNGVLHRLINGGVNLATTIHDAVLVEECNATITKSSMESIFRRDLNMEGPDSSVLAKVTILTANDDNGQELDLTW